MKSISLFYFSGTGNARQAAEWIAETCTEAGVEAHIFAIPDVLQKGFPPLAPDTLTGILSPTHGFNLPPVTWKFLWKLRLAQGQKVFLMNTRAGMKLHRLFLPGVSGVSQVLPALLLRFRGAAIVGMQPLDMPSNWITLHPGLREQVVSSIIGRCKQITVNFTQLLLAGHCKYKALWSLPLDLAIAPVALLYYFIGRFLLAKSLLSDHQCNGCALCARQCPVAAIEIINQRPFWAFRCESCMHCLNACPQRAIQAVHGYWFGMLVAASAITAWLYSLIWMLPPAVSHIMESAHFFVKSGITIALFALSYRLLFRVSQWRTIARVAALLSLTSLKSWRRYTKLLSANNKNSLK